MAACGRRRLENRMDNLQAAIEKYGRDASDAIERLRELASPEAENEVYDITLMLRLNLTLLGCLKRLCAGRTAQEIHAAFGAPGDFGYGTPLGDALMRIYRGES
jgi:hypothetical protein